VATRTMLIREQAGNSSACSFFRLLINSPTPPNLVELSRFASNSTANRLLNLAVPPKSGQNGDETASKPLRTSPNLCLTPQATRLLPMQELNITYVQEGTAVELRLPLP